MSATAKKPTFNLYGYQVVKIPNRPVVDPNLDGKPEEKKQEPGLTPLQLSLIIIASLFYVACSYIAAFHAFRAYGTNNPFDKTHRFITAILLGPFYILYVIIKSNVHALFGLAKGADMITMTGKRYYLHT